MTIFDLALFNLLESRTSYASSMQGTYEQYDRTLQAIRKKRDKALIRRQQVERIRNHYVEMCNTDERTLSNINCDIPQLERQKLGELNADALRDDFLWGKRLKDSEIRTVQDYIVSSASQIITRSMTQEQYDFLMKNSTMSIIKQLLQEARK